MTLEVTPRQSEQIAQAQQLGTLSLVLRPLRDAKIEAPEPEEAPNAAVTVVRFGMSSQISTH